MIKDIKGYFLYISGYIFFKLISKIPFNAKK